MEENRQSASSTPRTHANIWIFILIIMLGSIACVCTGSGSDEELVCTTTVSANGQSYTGESDSSEQSELNACNFYCLENDPVTDIMYDDYLTSNGLSRDEVSKRDAMFANEDILDQVTLVCAPQCVEDANAGLMDINTTCSG